MTGWLSKEILDHLDHAGYVAVPKERVEEVEATRTTAIIEMQTMMQVSEREAYEANTRHHLAMIIGRTLLERGFLDVQLFEPRPNQPDWRHRVSVWAIKPRTIR